MRTVFVVLILLIQCSSYGQDDALSMKKINAHYFYSSVGSNISVAYQFKHKKMEPFVGIMYHVNRPVNDLRYHAYRHRFYNKNFRDGLGINFGIARPIPLKKSDIGLFLLYTGQISHMHYRRLIAHCDTNSINYIVTRTPDYVTVFSPSQMWIVEDNFGIGINVKLYDNIYLTASAAAGVALYMVKNQYTNNEFFLEWEFSDHYRIGLSYLIPHRNQ